ncbi:MAG: glycosyltransferase [Lentisphaerota bacterium]
MARILICYLVRNSGHHSAARALEEALHKVDPSVETMCIDLLEYSHPKWSLVIQKFYMVTIRRTPEVWEALYDKLWLDYLTRKIRGLIQRGNSKPLVQLMEQFAPDAAVCTQAHPLAVLSAYAERNQSNIKLWGVVTDFIPHRFWVVQGKPAEYVVADDASAERMVWLGIPRNRTHILGIPINPGFVAERKTRISLEGGKRILVMGGSRGLGAKFRTLRYLDKINQPFTIDVVTGTNRKLRAQLVRRRGSFRHPIRIRGYVKDVVALMHRASLLISKPGGLTVAEATAVGLPMILIRPLPGQEKGNTDVLVRQGAAVHLQTDRDLVPIVSTLMGNQELLGMMRERALALGRPDAALDIAKKVLSSLNGNRITS